MEEDSHQLNNSSSEAPASVKPQLNLAQRLVQEILDKIDQEEWKPGEKIPKEADIMKAHGVSRTVVREALQRLQASGHVQTKHGVGTFVLSKRGSQTMDLSFDHLNDAVEILELRLSLEAEVASLAAKRRSPEQLLEIRQALDELQGIDRNGRAADASLADLKFHLAIAKAAKNHYFVDIMQHLENSLMPRKRINVGRVNHEHEEIYAAIERGDSDAARAAMRIHLINSRERFLALANQ